MTGLDRILATWIWHKCTWKALKTHQEPVRAGILIPAGPGGLLEYIKIDVGLWRPQDKGFAWCKNQRSFSANYAWNIDLKRADNSKPNSYWTCLTCPSHVWNKFLQTQSCGMRKVRQSCRCPLTGTWQAASWRQTAIQVKVHTINHENAAPKHSKTSAVTTPSHRLHQPFVRSFTGSSPLQYRFAAI